MDFQTLARERYSVRSFRDEPVTREITDKILDAALAAPTACNRQPFRITVVRSAEGMARFHRCTVRRFDAPMAMIVSCDPGADWVRPFDGKHSGEIDAAIVATHLMLAAAELGVGSTWVMHFDPAAVKTAFALPAGFEPVVLLPMGYAAEDARPSPMHSSFRPRADVVTEA